MRRALYAIALPVLLFGGLIPVPAATTAKPSISGCGTVAIAKADAGNVIALDTQSKCFATIEAIARDARRVRQDRIAALQPTDNRADVQALSDEMVRINLLRQAKWSPTDATSPAVIDAGLRADRAVSALYGPFVPRDGGWGEQPLAVPLKLDEARAAVDAYRVAAQ